jgi:hypothetical protein
MLAASHPFLTHDPVVWLTTISGMGVAWAGVYFRYVLPERRRHDAEKAASADKRRESDKWMYGGKNLDGTVSKGAPEKLRDVETSVDSLTGQVTFVVDGLKVVEKRMDEANGTGRATRVAVDATAADVKEIRAMIQGLATAGADAKLALGSDAKELATLTAESKSDILAAIHHDEGSPSAS